MRKRGNILLLAIVVVIPVCTLSFLNHHKDEAAALTEKSLFVDVSESYWARYHIEVLYQSGITNGCSIDPLKYCPEDEVTRAQMAVFLERGIHGAEYQPLAPQGIFEDVPLSYWAAGWIEALLDDGITSGCTMIPLNYCPDDPITRAQMAIFLLRSKYGAEYQPPQATGIMFSDVPGSYWAASWIEDLAHEEITMGCGGGKFCPDVR